MKNVLHFLLRRMRGPLILLTCVYAISVIGFVLIPGQDNDGNEWAMGFFHAFYFVSFMGSTIGFGEIPYEFTNAQRLWTLFTIYATVISWLYTIGSLISLVQSSLFQSALTIGAFNRRVKHINSHYFLICGYGDTGELMVRALTNRGKQCVVIDIDKNRVNDLELENFPTFVPALKGDASQPKTLIKAGLKNSYCKNIIAVTQDDEVNLKIAIASKLISPQKSVSCWVQTQDVERNMASFGTDLIVNPHDTFAKYLHILLTSPTQYWIREWLATSETRKLCEPVFPPKRGRWILCGYGRFGKAVYKTLRKLNLDVTVIEARPDLTHPPENSILGRGTEADTLLAADIKNAVGIIAGTDHDINNLSIIMTAKDRNLNPNIFTIARQERASHSPLFQSAKLDVIAHHSHIVSSQLLANITTPLTADFLSGMEHENEQWASILASRLLACVDENHPHSWVVRLNQEKAKAFNELYSIDNPVKLHHILRAPNHRKNRLPCVALLLRRANQDILLPDNQTELHPNDLILFAGNISAKLKIRHILSSSEVLHYTMTGRLRPTSIVLRWLSDRLNSHKAETDASNSQPL